MKLASHEINFTSYVGDYFLKNHIRSLRKEANITQQELADIVSVSSRTIISLEKGRYNPSVLLAYKIARVLNVHIEDLFIFEEEDENEH